jgi:hypothetical protein
MVVSADMIKMIILMKPMIKPVIKQMIINMKK